MKALISILVVSAACTEQPESTPASQASAPHESRQGYTVFGTNEAVKKAFEPAWEALRAQKPEEAERLGREVVDRYTQEPKAGFAVAIANFELATIRIGLRDHEGALAALRTSLTIPANTEEEKKSRLSYEMNLSDALLLCGQVGEAVEVAEKNVAGRKAFYGPNHAALAYGHRQYARALLATSDPEAAKNALREAKEAVRIFGLTNHFETTDAAIALAQARVATGAKEPLFEVELDREEVLTNINAATELYPKHLWPVVRALRQRWSSETELAIRLAELEVNAARAVGDHNARVAALEWLAGNVTDEEQRFGTQVALAIARQDAGKPKRAVEDLAAILGKSRGTAREPRVRRELGLLFSEQNKVKPAREHLQAGLRLAPPGEFRNRMLATLGVFEAHQRRASTAAPLLEEAVANLEPTHPDSITARNHLRGLADGKCGCEDPKIAFAATLEAYAAAKLPGLIEWITVGEDGGLEAHLARDATDEEAKTLGDLERMVSAAIRRQEAETYGVAWAK